MPGVAHIFGFLPFTNSRVLDREKPRTYTFDAEIVIGVDGCGEVQTIPVLVQHYVPVDGVVPSDGRLHHIWGKLACMDPSMDVGDGFNAQDYELLVEADHVRLLLLLQTDLIS